MHFLHSKLHNPKGRHAKISRFKNGRKRKRKKEGGASEFVTAEEAATSGEEAKKRAELIDEFDVVKLKEIRKEIAK